MFTPVAIDPQRDIAVLQYTGGTTGTPKGAMLTHANVYANVRQVQSWAPSLEYGKERVFGVLPFFHVFAMTVVMNFGIAIGAEIVILPRFVLDDALTLIAKARPTIMPGVPTLFNAILNTRAPAASIFRRSPSAFRAERRCRSKSKPASTPSPAVPSSRAMAFRKPLPSSPAIRPTAL